MQNKDKYILVNISPAMEQSLLIISGPSDGNNKFELDADTKPKVLFHDDNNDEFWLFNDDSEDNDIEENDDW